MKSDEGLHKNVVLKVKYVVSDYFLPNDGLQFIEVIRQKNCGIFERKFCFSFPLKERKNILPWERV